MYLGGVCEETGDVIHSHTNHNSEKRAVKWQKTYPEMGKAEEWNWQEVNKVSRQLNSHIRKRAVSKIGTRPVLENANNIITQNNDSH